MNWVRSVGRSALQNVFTVLFVAGAVVMVSGVHMWSPAAARVVGGLLCMTLATRPYLRPGKENG